VRIVVTGSLAYDYIMDFPGYFKDHILPEKVHMLAVSFLVDSMKKMRGGVAGNIAYTLALLGERPTVCAAAGQDFADYRSWMKRQGVDTSAIAEIADEFTASCFINTDRANNQIVAFYPGAMNHDSSLSLAALGLGPGDLVVISPTTPEAITRFAETCRTLGVPFVFDPGKQTPRLTGEQILAGLHGAAALVGNDYEFAMMAKATGKSEQELINAAPIAVVTRGAEGSLIYAARRGAIDAPLHVPVAPVAEVRDPTGAGDAYLGGLVFGLARGLPLDVTGRIAALAAAYTIEQRGCQEHHYTLAEFADRYARAFGSTPEVEALAVTAAA
jgi:adenosine kinase